MGLDADGCCNTCKKLFPCSKYPDGNQGAINIAAFQDKFMNDSHRHLFFSRIKSSLTDKNI